MIRISFLARLATRQLIAREVSVNYCRVARISSSHTRFYAKQIKETKELIAAQDSDTFGTLSVNAEPADDELLEEDDIKEEKFIKNSPRKSQKLSTKQYADMIKDHLSHQRIKEAIDVMEVKMIEEDRVKPKNYIFNLLIDGCAKVGYSAKAFKLFTKMRQRGLKITGATYTSLFTACAASPWPQDGLNKAKRVREIMLEKGFEPNASNYNAMIKAFGRCGDLKTAFLLVDEMRDKNLAIGVETFNFLLQACASDKEFGFRHALLVWHKMYQKRLKPDVYSFNLMLRCCRDTELGDVETMEEVLQTILLRNKSDASSEQLKIEAHSTEGKPESVQIVSPNEIEPVDPKPNLIALRPHLGNLITLKEVKRPEDRLLLLGGMTGFLELMDQFEVAPDLKTYTQLIEVIPTTKAAEKKLLGHLWKHEVKCDVDFFNILMKKRAMRSDYEGSKEVVEMIYKVKLQPDIVTYGVLALSCQTLEEARELIEEMNDRGVKMNIQILGAMLKAGCVNRNFQYVIDVLNLIKKERLKPSEKVIETLRIFLKSCNQLKKKDRKYQPENYRNDYHVFRLKFEKWMNEMGMKDLELEDARKLLKEAPWEQFQEVQADGYEDPKGQKLMKAKKYKRYIGKVRPKAEELAEIEKET